MACRPRPLLCLPATEHSVRIAARSSALEPGVLLWIQASITILIVGTPVVGQLCLGFGFLARDRAVAILVKFRKAISLDVVHRLRLVLRCRYVLFFLFRSRFLC